MHWRIKGTVQKVLGVMPGGTALHYRLQRRFGGLSNFERELSMKVDDWKIMVGHLRQTGLRIEGSRLFEIGTGWYPTFPLACYLAGARRITTYDLNRHLQPNLLRACIAGLERSLELIAQTSGAEETDVRARYARLQSAIAEGQDLEHATEGVVHYRAPADATRTALDEGEVDVVFSNSVLEHVPPQVIDAMYRESQRILAPGGLMFHSVNCGDHYAYVDRSIHQLNYLRYSDRQWKYWNNAFLYQNRMRAHEFVERAAAMGYEILLDTSTARPQRLRELAEMPVHPQFASVPAEKLCITSVDFIARKRESQESAAS
jgi:hypothetical protein